MILLFPWFWDQFSSSSTLLNWTVVFHFGHIFSLASTSFIEEEHQTAYFLASSVNLLLLYQLLCKQVNLDFKLADSYQSQSSQYLQQRQPNEDLKQNQTFQRKLITSAVLKCLVLMGILKIARCWNQTGDKWGHLVIFKKSLNPKQLQ